MRSPAILTLLLLLPVSGCERASEHEAAAAAPRTAREEREPEPLPRQIYFDLSGYPWYARAEPLPYEGRVYSPGGGPQAIALANLELAGNYQGVDFYVLRSDREPPDALYVPVFEGYWLPFTPQQ